MSTALVTGASSGLGAEYARQIAGRGGNLVLVARDREALKAVEQEIAPTGVQIEILVADLLVPSQRAKVEKRLSDSERPIDLLVNNAGFGLSLNFAKNDIESEVKHLQLHVEVTMRLMHAALSVMRSRGGRIINVASVAAFIPRSTYSACKAWVVNFSRWANGQYPQVSVTAVCPGYTHTNFHERIGLAPGEEGIPRFMWLQAPQVIRESLDDAAKGKSVSIPSIKYRILVALTKFFPDRILDRVGQTGR